MVEGGRLSLGDGQGEFDTLRGEIIIESLHEFTLALSMAADNPCNCDELRPTLLLKLLCNIFGGVLQGMVGVGVKRC